MHRIAVTDRPMEDAQAVSKQPRRTNLSVPTVLKADVASMPQEEGILLLSSVVHYWVVSRNKTRIG